jgi:hypothetical protein
MDAGPDFPSSELALVDYKFADTSKGSDFGMQDVFGINADVRVRNTWNALLEKLFANHIIRSVAIVSTSLQGERHLILIYF